MKKTIVIYAEKPDMGRKIADALATNKLIGNGKPQKCSGYITFKAKDGNIAVTWGYGHMYELKDAKEYDAAYAKWDVDVFPFFPKSYEIKPKEDVGSQLKVVKELFQSADTIINATDADREGELIFDYVLTSALKPEERKKKEILRMWIHATTPDALCEAYNSVKDISEYANVKAAARVRAAMDWVSGINLTVFTTKRFPKESDGAVSVGRVQTPTLALIVNREKEIQNFKSKPFWSIIAEFVTNKSEKYTGILADNLASGVDTYENNRYENNLSIDDAQSILNELNEYSTTREYVGGVYNIKSELKTRKPPLLYDLTALQMDANSKLGFTAEKTLSIAQKLYDKSYTTYPRTSSRYLPEGMKEQIESTLHELEKSPTYSSYFVDGMTWQPFTNRHFDDKKVVSHYAVVPTGKLPTDLMGDELAVYNLIVESLVRIIYPPEETINTTVFTIVKNYKFVSRGKIIKAEGWTAVGSDVCDENESENSAMLPPLNVNDMVKGAFESKKGETKPPKRYTDKTLLAAMENVGKQIADEQLAKLLKESGIGTPSTRAAIIETLTRRQYVERKGKAFVPTEKGMALIDFLPIATLKSAEMTGVMENRLLGIENGSEDPALVLKDFEKNVADWCAELKALPEPDVHRNSGEEMGKCPVCGGSVVKLHGKNGDYCKCTNSECSFSLNTTILEKKLTDEKIKNLLAGKSVAVSGLVSKKNGKTFSARLTLGSDGKIAFEFDNSKKKWQKGKKA